MPAVKPLQQKDTATPDKHANDRLVFILAAAIVSYILRYFTLLLTLSPGRVSHHYDKVR